MSDGDLAVLSVREGYKKAKEILKNPKLAKDKREYLEACQTVANIERLLLIPYYWYILDVGLEPENPALDPEDYTDEKIEEALKNQLQR